MEKINLSITCPICGSTTILSVFIADYQRWQDGVLAQDAFPYLSDDERESLISGICLSCWDNIFACCGEEDEP